jgi:flagellar basal body rod protein FlgG
LIDIESKVVDTIFNAVTAVYPNADVTTGYDEKTAVFPTVVVEEVNNSPYRQSATDDCSENHARITYEVNVYTDNTGTAKSVGKDILNIVDLALQGLKFRRIHRNKPLNLNRTVFRQYGRWEVIVGKPVTDGDNTIYQMYRR